MIATLLQGCRSCLTLIIMLPCACCMLVGGLLGMFAEYDDGRDAASSNLDFKFDERATKVEFVDSPPIAPFPGGASDFETWVVLELDEAQAREFEQAIKARPEWREMPLSDELRTHEKRLQGPGEIEGVEVKEKLPLDNEHGYYFFTGEIASSDFRIAIYDNETRRVYVWAVSY